MKYIKAWFRSVYSLPTILFILLVAVLLLTHGEPQPVIRGADPMKTEINQPELAAALQRFDLEAADSQATAGVSSEPYNLVEVGTFKVTWYCPCEKCCGKTDGITKSGTVATEGVTVGADWSVLSPGTEVFIEGIGWRIVEDTGIGIKGQSLDIFVNDHLVALENGKSYHQVFVKKAGS